MQDLTLVGVHDDGEHLVLVGPDGHRYRVRVDEPLRAAVRRDRARLGQLQVEQSGVLRPKDIQARIRAGQTAEEVAADSGVPVENVRRYEGPVLAEREFVARQARAVRVRRGNPGVPGSYPTLDELVTQRLTAREVDPTAVGLGRLADRGHLVRPAGLHGGRPRPARRLDATTCSSGTWPRSTTRRRWLLDEQPAEAPEPAAMLAPSATALPRSVARTLARERVYDVEADGGIRSVEDDRASAAAATVDLLDTLRERRGAGSGCPTRARSPRRRRRRGCRRPAARARRGPGRATRGAPAAVAARAARGRRGAGPARRAGDTGPPTARPATLSTGPTPAEPKPAATKPPPP